MDHNGMGSRKARARKRRRRPVWLAAILLLLLAAGWAAWRNGGERDAAAPAPTGGTPQATVLTSATPTSIGTAKPEAGTGTAAPGEGTPEPGRATAAPGKDAAGPQPSENPGTDNKGGGDPNRISFAFAGDILLAGSVETQMKKNGYDYPYSGVKDYLKGADLAVANLETPVTDKGTEQKKEYVYRSPPAALPAFAEAGFDLVNLANNHVMDYGPEGLLDTFGHLRQNGIPYIGAGRDADEAYRPVVKEVKGVKIAFLGFSRIIPEGSWKAGNNHPGVAETYGSAVPVEAIRKAKQQADLVVVIAHWGVERKDTPEKYQTELAHAYIDAGADLIVGSHPHVLQGFEKYKDKWIAYSLGNFIFTTNTVRATLDSGILQASCGRDGQCELKLVPIFTEYAHPVVMDGQAGLQLFDRLSGVSFHARIEPDGTIVGTNP